MEYVRRKAAELKVTQFLNDKTPLCGGGKRWEKSLKEKNIACDTCVLDRPVSILTVDSASLFISFLQI